MNFAQKYIFIVLHAKCDILYFRFIALQQFSGKCHINKDFVIYQLKLLCMAGLAIACLSLRLSFSLSPPHPPRAPLSLPVLVVSSQQAIKNLYLSETQQFGR